MAFNYEAETPADVVASVAAAIRSSCRLAPLTDEQKTLRRAEIEAWQEQQAFLAQEHDRQQAENEAAQRQEQADALAESNRQLRIQAREKANREYQERQERQSRSYDLAILRNEAQQSSLWRSTVQGELRRQHVESLYGELEKMLSSPQPTPEPDAVYVEAPDGSDELGTRDFNHELWMQKPRRWW